MKVYTRIKEILAAASGVVLAAPVKLPPKVVVVAKYVALAIGLLEAAERVNDGAGGTEKGDADEGQPAS